MNDLSQPRRTIVHLSKHCGRGNGNVHVAVDLACEQARAGHTVYFCSGEGTFVPLLEREGVHYRFFAQDQKKPAALLGSMVALTRLCRTASVDILHAHMMGGVVVGAVASRLANVPLVATVHNSFDRHSVLMRLGDRVVAVSEADRKALVERGFSPDRTRVVWNAPVASVRNAHSEEDVSRSVPKLSHPNIVMICGLHARKGVFDVIEAATMLLPSMPEWTLYIAGEGPDRVYLEQRVMAAGLTDRIVFLGYVEHPEALYSQTDIFVLASYADPGSLTIGEARAAGCAIVATSVGGTPEMLEFGAAGCLIPPGRSDILARELGVIMRDPSRRETMRKAARRGAEIFDVKRLVPDYMRIYEEVIRRPRIKTKHRTAASDTNMGRAFKTMAGQQEGACPK
ncbi:glycosyltransferase family 4 protein [Acetobacter estunensis]|uniref:glycosyltransferase family 4 protein n=1 Tax=Acetobacter estunensis TaxID=104097 RepID=UPI001C2DB89D|nr:glycosyltransferase family 4 protein [Acetobacter estunensis]MBV1837829.1 glycosyltransferase family 4 protein [Acetobacter estunensis]